MLGHKAGSMPPMEWSGFYFPEPKYEKEDDDTFDDVRVGAPTRHMAAFSSS